MTSKFAVSAGAFNPSIYIGKLNAKGDAFTQKEDHTDGVLLAVAQYALREFPDGLEMVFTRGDEAITLRVFASIGETSTNNTVGEKQRKKVRKYIERSHERYPADQWFRHGDNAPLPAEDILSDVLDVYEAENHYLPKGVSVKVGEFASLVREEYPGTVGREATAADILAAREESHGNDDGEPWTHEYTTPCAIVVRSDGDVHDGDILYRSLVGSGNIREEDGKSVLDALREYADILAEDEDEPEFVVIFPSRG